jgi:hypothetical protein
LYTEEEVMTKAIAVVVAAVSLAGAATFVASRARLPRVGTTV